MSKNRGYKSFDDTRGKATIEDVKKYQDAWSKMMVTIWREKIERLHVVDTHSLYATIEEGVISSQDQVATIRHRFLEYGIYQDCGVGNGYKKRNENGNLYFLDPEYREAHNMGEPRKPREWFSRAYFASIKVLQGEMAYIWAEQFCAIMVEKIEETNFTRSTSMRSKLWGSNTHHRR